MEAECKPKANRKHFLYVQFILGCVALLIASAWLSPIEGGWNWEPLCWLVIFWYGVTAILVQMVTSRGRLSIRSLVILTTCCVLLIGFPFSSVRKATVRARALNRDAAVEHYGWLKLAGWRRLPQGDLLPCCLHWRLPKGFEFPTTSILFEEAAQLVDVPQLLRDEVESLEIYIDSQTNAEVTIDAIQAIQRMPKLRKITLDSLRRSPLTPALRDQWNFELDLPQLRQLHIAAPQPTPQLTRSLLSSKNLVDIQILAESVNEAELSQLQTTKLLRFKAFEIRASPQLIAQIVQANPKLLDLGLGAHHLDVTAVSKIEKLEQLIFLTVCGHSSNSFPSPCLALSWPKSSKAFQQLSLAGLDLSQLETGVQRELGSLGDRVACSTSCVGTSYLLSALKMKEQANFDTQIMLDDFTTALVELELPQYATLLQNLEADALRMTDKERYDVMIQYKPQHEELRYSLFKAIREKAMLMDADASADFAMRLQQLKIKSNIPRFNPPEFWLCGAGMFSMQQEIDHRIAEASR